MLPRHCWVGEIKKKRNFDDTYNLCAPLKGSKTIMHDAH